MGTIKRCGSHRPSRRKLRRFLGIVGTTLLLSATAALGGEHDLRDGVLVIPRMTPPTIDGTIDPAEWPREGRFSINRDNQTGNAAELATQAYCGYDNDFLYLAMECAEPEVAQLKGKTFPGRDGAVFENDSIEFFLQPTGDYMHFAVDFQNQTFDALGNDSYGYNPAYKSEVKRFGDKWCVEIAIPFGTLSGKAPQEGAEWFGDFFRNRSGKNWSWLPTRQWYATPRYYGFLIFGSARNSLTKTIAEIRDNLNGIAADSPRQPEAATLAAAVAKLETQLNQADDTSLKESYIPLRRDLQQQADRAKLLRFTEQWNNCNRPLAVQPALAISPDEPGRLNTPPPEKFNWTLLQDETHYQAFNLTNIGDEKLYVRASLRYGQTPGTDGRHTNIDFLRLGMTGCESLWYQTLPVATSDDSIAFDLIAKNPSGVYQIAPGETIQAVLALTPSAKTPETANGYLVFQPINGNKWQPWAFPVELKTVQRSLFADNYPFYSFGWERIYPAVFAERPEFVDEYYRILRDNGFTMAHICAGNHLPLPDADATGKLIGDMDFSRLDAILASTKDRFDVYFVHLAIFNKGQYTSPLFHSLKFGTPAWTAAFKDWFQQSMNRIESAGVDKSRVLINVYDESVGIEAQSMARWIKELDPEYRILINSLDYDMNLLRKIDENTDVWMPHYLILQDKIKDNFFKMTKEHNKKVTAYYYSTGENEKLKSPYAEYMLKFWGCQSNGIEGLGFWAAGQFYGDPMYRANYHNYDTSLVYPTETGLELSRRLLGWNRGFQDYHLLRAAEETLQNDPEKLENFQKKRADVLANPRDTTLAEAVRQECRELLDNSLKNQ